MADSDPNLKTMTINQTLAKEVVAAIDKASALCDESLRAIKQNESLGHVNVFGKLAGEFLGHTYTNILAPIWKSLPEIEPVEMKAPYIEPDPTLSPESKAALVAFIAEAHSAISTIKRNFSPEELQNFLQHGGLPEVEKTVVAIEKFLENPRFHDSVVAGCDESKV